MPQKMRAACVVSVILGLSGCFIADDIRRIKADADYAEAQAQQAKDRSAIVKLYRECLEKYAADPKIQKERCEVYTQTLNVLDVRGVK